MPPDPLVPTPGSLVCSRWIAPDDVSLCEATDFTPPEIFPLVLDAATDLLFAASGRQFTGVCSDTIRPPSANAPGGSWFQNPAHTADGGIWLGEGGTSALPQSTFGFGVQTADVVSSSGFAFSTVHLPGFPVVDVQRVTIDGVDLPDGTGADPKGWLIVDDRWLVRRDGLSWPLWQREDRPVGEADTWEIEYTFGPLTPPAGILALQVLVCELGKSWRGDQSCRLPKRLQSITREGMTAVILDPFKFLDEGKFGIYEIDVFVLAVNPHRLTRDGKVLNPDLLVQRPYRVR